MFAIYLAIISLCVRCIFLVNASDVLNTYPYEIPSGPESAALGTATRHLDHQRPNGLIELLSSSISDGFLTSEVFGEHAIFRDNNPHDLLVRVANGFLKRAGVYNPALAEIAGKAVEKAGFVDSQLFFEAEANLVAKFLFKAGLLVNVERVTYFSLRTLSAVDLVGCLEGVWDTESLMNAVAGGLFELFDSLDLVNYDKLKDLFDSFAAEIEELSNKIVYFK